MQCKQVGLDQLVTVAVGCAWPHDDRTRARKRDGRGLKYELVHDIVCQVLHAFYVSLANAFMHVPGLFFILIF